MLTDGERWTEDQLTQLRAARWRPRAQFAFLVAAQARANSTRRRRPALARQERAWTLLGGAAWLVLSRLRSDGVFRRVQTRGLVWWAGCALMLDWHLGLLETPTGRPVRLGPADALTMIRAWLVPAVAEGGDLRLLLIGALTDIGDGRLARATRCTRFGRDLEGVVDACFFLAALRGAVAAGHLAPRVAALERGRLLAGTAYSVGAFFENGPGARARCPPERPVGGTDSPRGADRCRVRPPRSRWFPADDRHLRGRGRAHRQRPLGAAASTEAARTTRWTAVTATRPAKLHAIVSLALGRTQKSTYTAIVSVPSASPAVNLSERSSPS